MCREAASAAAAALLSVFLPSPACDRAAAWVPSAPCGARVSGGLTQLHGARIGKVLDVDGWFELIMQ